MDTHNDVQPVTGMDVVGSDGEKVGSILNVVESRYIVVSKGFFFPTNYYIPLSAIASSDASAVYLRVSRDEALNQGWDTDPGSEGNSALDTAPDTTIVPLSEEVIDIDTRDTKQAEVQVKKNVVEEEQSFEVPVSEERVNVSRTIVDRDVEPGETIFEEETIRVPVYGEEVEVVKRTRVREEIEITKDRVENIAQVTETVRREEAKVIDDGNVIVDRDSTPESR